MESNLAEAILTIQESAASAVQPDIHAVLIDDGKGGTLEVPVAMLPNGRGTVVATPLLNVMRDGLHLARERRLALADGPDRREGTAHHASIESFIEHANRFKAENSAVWANPCTRQLVTVFDYHPEGASSPARWGKHRGVYACPLSDAWMAWGGGEPLELDQDGFAALLDSRDGELASGSFGPGAKAPDPATLITLANNLEVHSSASAKRTRDPNTGRLKVTFSEEKGVVGEVMPPPAFLIMIPIFQDSHAEQLEVRLRVTIEEGHAKFTVQIHRGALVLGQAFRWLCSLVKSRTELPVFMGLPE